MKAKLDKKDALLFREAMRDVKPLTHDRHSATPRRRPARARFARAFAVIDDSLQAELSDPEVGSGDELSFRRPGVSASVLRKLRRGEVRVVGELDLHGLTVVQARHALQEFLTIALARRAACVRIIHGKGLRSERGPVLKALVSGLLRRTPAVVAYVSALPADGGTGALYVLLAH